MSKGETPGGKGIGALDLIEEATSLLRGAPAEVLALYYLGTLPFMLGLLYFWADMSRGAGADGRLAGASLGLAILFIWMKYWQARFCRRLAGLVMNGATPPSAPGIVMAQAIYQPWGLLVLPLALLITLPFGWCFAFFQNITVMGGGPDLRRLHGAARRQAMLWPGQNHVLIFIFFLLGLVIFANFCVAAFFLPRAMKTLFGMESLFTRSNMYLLNSTFWAAMAVLAHICVDPLIKAAYLLRCHYGESLATGADLLAELKEASRPAVAAAVLFLAAALLFTGIRPAAGGAAAESATAPRAVDAQKLDKTITQVINGPEFAWHFPRPAHKKGELPGFLRSVVDFLKDWGASIGEGIKRFLRWLADILPRIRFREKGAPGGTSFRDYALPLMYLLLAICLSAGGVYLWRQLGRRGKTGPVAEPPPLVAEPDVGDESVMADELSEERWRAMARELFAAGELRLGLRALYLACLAFLAQERLIAIARYKSNRDYERELGRFSHALPEVAASFSRNVALFERAWYGTHRPEQGTVETFTANHERIVTGVRQG